MRKTKKEVITLTHTEIIAYALTTLTNRFIEEEGRIKGIEGKYPDLAKELRESDLEYLLLKEKIKIACALYKVETGVDYNLDVDLGE